MRFKKYLISKRFIVSAFTVFFMFQMTAVSYGYSNDDYKMNFDYQEYYDPYKDYDDEDFYEIYGPGMYGFDEDDENFTAGDYTEDYDEEAEELDKDEEYALKASKLDNPVKKLVPAIFSSNNILFESDKTKAWDGETGNDGVSKSLGMDEFKCSFYVDQEIIISDIYFSTNYKGIIKNYNEFAETTPEIVPLPANLKITVEKYENSGGRTFVQSFPAKVYTCPETNPLIYNTFKQLTGAGNVNMTLKKGVYMIRITPQDASFSLIGAETKSDDEFFADSFNNASTEYGVVMTGSFTGGGAALFRNYDATWGALKPIIEGANAGKSMDEINSDMVKEIERQLELRKKEQEEAQKAAAEKAAKEAAEAAKKTITLKINGNVVKTDSAPVIEDGRTLVPVRAIVEELGYIVSWNSTTQIIDVYDVDGALRISMKVSSKKVSVATGIYGVMDEKTLDVPAKVIGGRTMVPARFIAETLGCEVKWDQTSRTVTITANQG